MSPQTHVASPPHPERAPRESMMKKLSSQYRLELAEMESHSRALSRAAAPTLHARILAQQKRIHEERAAAIWARMREFAGFPISDARMAHEARR